MALNKPVAKGKHRGPPKGVSNNPAGRPKGVITKALIRSTDENIKAAQAEGRTPVDSMMRIIREYEEDLAKMRDMEAKGKTESLEKFRARWPYSIYEWAIEKSAPYTNRKMPVSIDGGEGKPIAIIDADKLATMSDDDVKAMYTRLKATIEVALAEDAK